MTHRSNLYEMMIDLGSGTGSLPRDSALRWGVACLLQQDLIGPVQYGWDRFCKDPQSMVFGGGLLAGSPLPGTRRMIICGNSPSWEGFYVSALGGAMHVFHRMGVNYLWLRGKAPAPSALIINHMQGQYSVRLETVDLERVWQGYTDAAGCTRTAFYALQQMLFERHKDEYEGDMFRILAVGPAALHTREGAIGSNAVRRGQLSVIDDWAGRGGLGSLMLQQHNVAAIVYGGDWQDPALKEARELDQYFLEHFGKRAMECDLAMTEKYRYVEKFDTGGTFGVNMHESEDRLFSFNYQSIYASSAARLEQHENFIASHYLKQFNEECIEPRNFAHCGEPCPVVCKKYVGEYKKDYEPYQALGPNAGIFDQRAAEQVNKLVDSMGWDSIQAGGTVSWIMELVAEGLLPPQDFGLPLEPPPFRFASKPGEFDVVRDSARNALYAEAIVNMILFDARGEPFRRGMRAAARWLDDRYGIRSIDRAVYTAHGNNGCMVPNQYWVPGMFVPMPLMGKYFSFYGVEFLPPYQLGRKSVERFVYELYAENSGSCRFHRKWVEDIIDDIILAHFNLHFDYWHTNFSLAKAIHEYQSGTSGFWESQRVVDIIAAYLKKWQEFGLKDAALDEWVQRFEQDAWKAGRAYWEEVRRGIADACAENIPEPPHGK